MITLAVATLSAIASAVIIINQNDKNTAGQPQTHDATEEKAGEVAGITTEESTPSPSPVKSGKPKPSPAVSPWPIPSTNPNKSDNSSSNNQTNSQPNSQSPSPTPTATPSPSVDNSELLVNFSKSCWRAQENSGLMTYAKISATANKPIDTAEWQIGMLSSSDSNINSKSYEKSAGTSGSTLNLKMKVTDYSGQSQEYTDFVQAGDCQVQ